METDALTEVPPDEEAVSFHAMAVFRYPWPSIIKFALLPPTTTFSLPLYIYI